MSQPQAVIPNEYETIYILRPDAGREASERVSERVRDVIGKQDGKLTRVENWGYRKLAYTVRKQTRGVYVYLKYLGSGNVVAELARNLRLQESVLKFQTIATGKRAAAEAEPEPVEFEHLESISEDPEEVSLARELGLEDGHDDGGRHRGNRDGRETRETREAEVAPEEPAVKKDAPEGAAGGGETA